MTREELVSALSAIERTLASRVVTRVIVDAEGRELRRIYRGFNKPREEKHQVTTVKRSRT